MLLELEREMKTLKKAIIKAQKTCQELGFNYVDIWQTNKKGWDEYVITIDIIRNDRYRRVGSVGKDGILR